MTFLFDSLFLAEASDQIWELLRNPFVLGLLLGLIFVFWTAKSAFTAKRMLKKEIKRLEQENQDLTKHLNTELKIKANASVRLDEEMKALREQNEILRGNLALAQQSISGAEKRQLQLMQVAVSRLNQTAPGFSPAWEKALAESEQELQQGETGLKKWVRMVLPNKSAANLSKEDVRNLESH